MPFGFIGKALKGIGGVVGKVAKKVAPLASFIPGVGPIAGAALGQLGGLGGGGDKGGGGGPSLFGIPLETLLSGGLGVAGAISAGRQRGESNEILREVIERERAAEEARQPFRDAAIAGLLGTPVAGGGRTGGLQFQRADLSQAFADPTNPFAQPVATQPEPTVAAAEPPATRPGRREPGARPPRRPPRQDSFRRIGKPRRDVPTRSRRDRRFPRLFPPQEAMN